jgi:hypothetical protein
LQTRDHLVEQTQLIISEAVAGLRFLDASELLAALQPPVGENTHGAEVGESVEGSLKKILGARDHDRASCLGATRQAHAAIRRIKNFVQAERRDRDIFMTEQELADQKADKCRVTAHPDTIFTQVMGSFR